MNSKERVMRALNHQQPDRVPIQDVLWRSTIARWKMEGLPADLDEHGIDDYLGFDMVKFVPDLGPQLEQETIETTAEYVIERNSFGEVVKNWPSYSTTPQVLESPVKNRHDWDRFKERLHPHPGRAVSSRFLPGKAEAEDWMSELERYQRARRQGKFVLFGAIVGYDAIQRYLGSERLLVAIATEPDWVREMYMTQAESAISMCELMKQAGFTFDGAFLACDLGYRNTLLFSPEHYLDQQFPADRRLCHYFRDNELPVILHSDGHIRPLIPSLIEAGFTCLQPLEVKAGMDVRELKHEFGDQLAFMGGIDARALAHPDFNVIEEEIKSKFAVAKAGGGYIYHSDHSVPDNVSFERYQQVLKLVKEYGEY